MADGSFVAVAFDGAVGGESTIPRLATRRMFRVGQLELVLNFVEDLRERVRTEHSSFAYSSSSKPATSK